VLTHIPPLLYLVLKFLVGLVLRYLSIRDKLVPQKTTKLGGVN